MAVIKLQDEMLLVITQHVISVLITDNRRPQSMGNFRVTIETS